MSGTGIGSGMETLTAAASPDTELAPLGTALVQAGEELDRLYVLSADLAKYTDVLPFAERFPDRFVNVGMAEQNLLGVAAGLAHEGLIAVATTYGAFATRRALDFLEIQIALMRRNVKVVAGLPGLTTGYGGTHQGIDDIGITRAVPNLVVLDPADAVELREATRAMLAYDGPVYLRLQRGAVPVLPVAYDHPFHIGRARWARGGGDVTIVACGVMVGRALAAAETLAAEGIAAGVLNASTLKPFDQEAVLEAARRTGCLVTAENHSVVGGLYGAVAETLARSGVPATVRPVGIADEYCGYGSPSYLARRHGIATEHIEAAVREILRAGPAR